MSYCIRCDADREAYGQQRKVVRYSEYRDFNGNLVTQDDSYWVTDYYCSVCNNYLQFPSATNARHYNAQRSASVSMWLWVPVYFVLVVLFHQQVSPQLSHLSADQWGKLFAYVLVVLLLPMGICSAIHNLLPKFLVENIALLMRAPVVSAIEAIGLGIPLYVLCLLVNATWFSQLALCLEIGFVLIRIPVRLKEIINENRLRNILNRRSK